MKTELRERQRLNLLTCNISPLLRDRFKEHNGTGGQLSLWPNRLERISPRALYTDVMFLKLLTLINGETRKEALHGIDSRKASMIDDSSNGAIMSEPNRASKHPVREIRMRGASRVLSSVDSHIKGRYFSIASVNTLTKV